MKNLFKLFFVLIFGMSNAQTVGLIEKTSGSLDDGYVLFAPISSTTTYLIDKCGKRVKTWPSTYRPSLSVYLTEDGYIVRPGKLNNTTFTTSGSGGIIQKIDWNGNVVWSYTISDATRCQHHDLKVLPNGNILVIAWELKTNAEAIAAGRNPNLVNTTLWSEQILELQPVGTNQANIVWEWHLWDHLVQDIDATKQNFGNISTNPQLLNINFNAVAGPTGIDWIHLNAIDYNEELDQIILSSRFLDEIWIIDHSTTTAQAASHSGGNSGKGGDILYRWGNPASYNNGTLADRKLFGQHNARWIGSGFPFQNQIMIFNNGFERTGGNYSTVEIINPPLNGFNYTQTLPYLPAAPSWIYNAGNPNIFFATNISGAQQLSNGNVLFCDGPAGTFTEVTTNGSTVWKYVNPVVTSGILAQGAAPSMNTVFKCDFYPSNYSGFAGQTLIAGNTIENSNVVSASCNLVLNANENIVSDSSIKIYPNPASEWLKVDFGEHISNGNLKVKLINSLGQVVYEEDFINSNLTIPVKSFAEGIYILVINKDELFQTSKVIIRD